MWGDRLGRWDRVPSAEDTGRRLRGVRVGFAVSIRVGEALVDPDPLLSRVADLARDNGIGIDRRGSVAWFTAAETSPLVALAEPLTSWWLGHEPTPSGSVVLRFAGPNGIQEISYCRPDLAVESVGYAISSNSGRVYESGEAPGPMRRLAARLSRLVRTGFTASELVVTDDDVLMVALSGRDLDDRPRSIEFQTFNPAAEHYDPDDDDGYCIVNEDHATIHRGLHAVRLTGRVLAVSLTPEAARAWGLRSTRLTIKLRLDDAQILQAQAALRGIFASSPTPPPELAF